MIKKLFAWEIIWSYQLIHVGCKTFSFGELEDLFDWYFNKPKQYAFMLYDTSPASQNCSDYTRVIRQFNSGPVQVHDGHEYNYESEEKFLELYIDYCLFQYGVL